jgi:hypothetical protein
MRALLYTGQERRAMRQHGGQYDSMLLYTMEHSLTASLCLLFFPPPAPLVSSPSARSSIFKRSRSLSLGRISDGIIGMPSAGTSILPTP